MLIPIEDLFSFYNIHPKGVLHIGASYGQEIESYYSNGIERSVWIEAIPEVYEDLKRIIAPYPNSIAINACITDTDNQNILFNISNNEAQSSSIFEFDTHATEHPTVKFIDHITLKTKRVDTLLKESAIDISLYPLVNLDLQGAELLALKSFGNLLNKVQCIYIEVNEKHLYKDCPLVGEIDEYLRQFDFKRVATKILNFGWGDAFYLKLK